ncbi:MAG: acyltransferase [Nitrospinae bacterium]|nr:acyltransferase [Nitrospinota bacterium]
MLAKIFRLFGILTSGAVYKELCRWGLYYVYEHALPMKRLKVGSSPEIHPTVSLRFEKNIALGNNIILDMNCCLWASEHSMITIGDNTGIGPGTVVISSNHSFAKGRPAIEQPLNEKDIAIGDNVWVGANSVILAGANIGSGSVIGAGCVISRTIPADSVVVSGNRTLSIVKKK